MAEPTLATTLNLKGEFEQVFERVFEAVFDCAFEDVDLRQVQPATRLIDDFVRDDLLTAWGNCEAMTGYLHSQRISMPNECTRSAFFIGG